MRTFRWASLSQLSLIVLTMLMPGQALAEAIINGKQLMILRPGLDAVYGSLVVAAQNQSEAPAPLQASLMIPKETSDFVPQQGLAASEMTLGETGIAVQKDLPPGTHILMLGFQVLGSFGGTELTLVPNTDIDQFMVLIPKEGTLQVAGEIFGDGEAPSPDPMYRSLASKAPLKAGETYTLAVTGLPEGRARFWWIGGLAGLLLLGAAVALSMTTKPQIRDDEEEFVVHG